MKKYVKKSIYVLNIVIDLTTDTHENIAATNKINLKHHGSSRQLSNEQFEELKNTLDQILKILKDHKFNVLKHYQSGKSYTYYFRFIPTDADGNNWPYEAMIMLEIRDHSSKTHEEGWLNSSIYAKPFLVGNKTCLNVKGLVAEVTRICDNLKNGDYSDLVKLVENT